MNDTLIVYHSFFHNIETLALEIAKQTGGTLRELIPENNYSFNWFKTMAPPVLSFLRQHDLADKTVIPFCTHGGGGFCRIEKDVAKECSQSRILPGIAVSGPIIPEEVTNWLEAICDLSESKGNGIRRQSEAHAAMLLAF